MHAVTIFKLFKCNLCIQQIATNKRHKVLTFSQTTQLEILSMNIKLQKLCILMWWENDPLKRISKSAEQTEKRRKSCINRLK